MKVTNYPNAISKTKKTMIIGSFNSFHNGHKVLLDVANSFNETVTFLIVTGLNDFDNNVKKPFHTQGIMLQHLSNLGVKEVIIVKLDNEIKMKDGKKFAQELWEKYNIKRFVVGHDFSMGKNSSYTAKMLEKDFDTVIVKSKKINEKKLSTSLLREFVEFGNVNLVKKNSPFYFTISTRVNNKNNFEIDALTPHPGIYATWAIVNDVKYWSTVRISKTGIHEIIVPDLIIKNSGFDVQIEFAKQIRAVIRSDFDKLNDKDKEEAVEYLKNHL